MKTKDAKILANLLIQQKALHEASLITPQATEASTTYIIALCEIDAEIRTLLAFHEIRRRQGLD